MSRCKASNIVTPASADKMRNKVQSNRNQPREPDDHNYSRHTAARAYVPIEYREFGSDNNVH